MLHAAQALLRRELDPTAGLIQILADGTPVRRVLPGGSPGGPYAQISLWEVLKPLALLLLSAGMVTVFFDLHGARGALRRAASQDVRQLLLRGSYRRVPTTRTTYSDQDHETGHHPAHSLVTTTDEGESHQCG